MLGRPSLKFVEVAAEPLPGLLIAGIVGAIAGAVLTAWLLTRFVVNGKRSDD